MFRANTSHLQGSFFNTVSELSEGARKVLEKSWAGTFYKEIFSRINEEIFAVLYSEKASRPNVPVNVLLCLEILKDGLGWTDEEMYRNYLFDLSVRVALGYENMSDGYFSIRTIYHFRDALSKHAQETGENLFEQVFEQMTDEQIEAFCVKTDKQRTDSTQLMSNIRKYSRISLLVEVLRRVNRMLSAEDQQKYASLLAPYIKGGTDHYVYGLKSSEYPRHLGTIGNVMHQLVSELEANYSKDSVYEILVRAFGDHFRVEENEVELIPSKEVKADSLQSPDDLEATYRKKHGKSYQGYVANATETCNPDNDFQLITKMQTESNVTDDADMLIDAIPDLAERTDIDTCYSDGGYNSPELDPLLEKHEITHVQTAIRGGKPNPDQVTVSDFFFKLDPDGQPTQATCPQGQTISLEPTQTENRFIGRPNTTTCESCPLFPTCAVRPTGSQRSPALYLHTRQILLACKRLALKTLSQDERNLRPPIESAMHSLKNPFRHGKLLVRGKFRVSCALIASAAMTNLRRIHRAQQTTTNDPTSAPSISEFASIASDFTQKTIEMTFFSRLFPQCSLFVPTPLFGLTLPTFHRNLGRHGFFLDNFIKQHAHPSSA